MQSESYFLPCGSCNKGSILLEGQNLVATEYVVLKKEHYSDEGQRRLDGGYIHLCQVPGSRSKLLVIHVIITDDKLSFLEVTR